LYLVQVGRFSSFPFCGIVGSRTSKALTIS
jgi:hypothetical protein